MSLVAPVENGKIVSTSSADSASSTKKSGESGGDTISSDTFLSLLVAEMQNQDPLEPTSNTEWVSQYATFTMVEGMNEMAGSMDLMRASGLVGQNVIMKTTSSTGEQSYVQGIVDFVTYEDGEAYLYINDEPYALADLDTVASSEYMEAFELATEFKNKLSKMPTVATMTTEYEKTVKELYDMWNNMTEYQKTFVAKDLQTQLTAYVEKLKTLGVSFGDETVETPEISEEETVTTADLLNAFNTKMDAILEALKSAGSSGASGGEEVGEISDDDVSKLLDGADEATGVDNTGDADGTDDTDGTGNEESTGNAGTTGNVDGTGTTEDTEGTENAGSTDATGSTESGNEEAAASGGVTDSSASSENTENSDSSDNSDNSSESV